ncbi:hypothetical protein PRIPAC_73157, partial [Pristionchus pacificus]|uniref:G protein-coupled receptor n=1 Tax=Pristionchus pacificus TaxID=54126 RepID=A0A2A6CAD7_PRIPA
KLHYQIYFVTNTSGTISLIISTPLLYAIFFHSGKTSRDYKSFLVAAQILNISHDVVYNFSFAPVMDEVFELYEFNFIYISSAISCSLLVGWINDLPPHFDELAVISLFIRLQCAFCNVSALFYRHQIVQFPGSRCTTFHDKNMQRFANLISPHDKKFQPWKCFLLAIGYNIFICLVFIPMKLLSADQGRWKDVVSKEFLPGGRWILDKPSILIVPRLFDQFFYIMFGYSLIASILSAVMFTMTAKLITKTLNDNRSMLSKSTKVQHTRAIAALRAQSSAPLIFVTIPMNIMMFIVYILLLGLPSLQFIIATVLCRMNYRREAARSIIFSLSALISTIFLSCSQSQLHFSKEKSRDGDSYFVPPREEMNHSNPNDELERNIAIYYRSVGTISCFLSAPLLYAIIFHSGKTNRDYQSFIVVAQILNILHDFAYNFSFAPILDEVFSLFIRLQCACCNFGQLFYRHQLIQPSESKFRLPPWLCILIGFIYNIFICSVLIPLSQVIISQRDCAEEIIKREILPGGEWILQLPSFLIIPHFGNAVQFASDNAFTVFAILSVIASTVSAILFVLTSKLIINTLHDSRNRLSKTSKRQHTRAIAALRMQSIVPLINVTLPLNLIMLTNSLLPPMHWMFYVVITAMPALQSIFSSLITIYFQTTYRLFFLSLLSPLLRACNIEYTLSAQIAK